MNICQTCIDDTDEVIEETRFLFSRYLEKNAQKFERVTLHNHSFKIQCRKHLTLLVIPPPEIEEFLTRVCKISLLF